MPELRLAVLNQMFGPTFTGRGLQIKTLAGELSERGVEVHVVTESLPGAPKRERGSTDAYTVHRVPLDENENALAEWWSRRRAVRRILEIDPDLLHVYGDPHGVEPVLLAARVMGVRTVFSPTLLGSDDLPTIRRDGRLGWLRAAAFRTADHNLAICPAVEETFRQAGVDEADVTHIPNAVDTDRFRPADDRNAAAGDVGLETSAPRALFVGTVGRRKGVDVLLEAWRRVTAELPDAQLYVAGPTNLGREGELSLFKQACRAFVERHRLGDSIHFLGQRANVAPLYRAAHTVLFPSRREGFPNVLLESMASGTPPVAARIPGSTDASVDDGRTGYVVPQEDAGALAERAITLLRDVETRDRMAEAAREKAVDRYALPRIAGEHLDLYRRIVGGHPSAAGTSAAEAGRASP